LSSKERVFVLPTLALRACKVNGKAVSRVLTLQNVVSALLSFAVTALAIVAAWWWLGSPIPLPPSALSPGEKLWCLSYAPFRGAQDPLVEGTRVPPEQIDEDLALLAKYTNCIRTYSVDDGRDDVLKSARRYGLKVMHGVWVSGDPEKTRRQVEASIAYAKQYPDVITAIVVGNEVLLRGEMTAASLIAVIREIKAQVAMPVTYADVWEFWLRYPDVQSAVDFVTIHVLPYWEDFPIPASRAASHLVAIRNKVAAVFPGKEIVIGEFGWPSAGRMREDARPSPYDQARAVIDTLAAAKAENIRVNIIEAFDQPWKRALEGAVGGYWGIIDRTVGGPKFSFSGGSISNHPDWPLQALAGIILAALTFGGAAWSRRRKGTPAHLWVQIGALALIPAVLFGWTIETVLVESFSPGSWARSLAFAAVSGLAPIICAAGLATGRRIPAFALLIGGGSIRRDHLDWALGGILIALMLVAIEAALGLVFDPRYRDIPFAPLTAAVVPFLTLLVAARHLDGTRARAESVAGIVLTLSAGYILFNETFANWQSVWFCAGLLGLAAILLSVRAAPSSE
jgi:exo-beta-1,3-glucanase (GH17 family)